ncbi:Uncharacterised protein [Mycobacteroides abscessus subsp. abscessus]|nr:Uncharacterised protein [Mycobacteroides abscessus subsp. abscessus]SIN57514.1 Uncharacterised protein [Mycobacteroides abscessus subsp. abscessus]
MAGIRPVETWKYTAASPTPIRLGPRSGTPCRLAPWQVMHEVSYNCLPVRSRADLSSSATATCGVGVKVEAKPPATTSAISSSKPAETRRRNLRRARFLAAVSFTGSTLTCCAPFTGLGWVFGPSGI